MDKDILSDNINEQIDPQYEQPKAYPIKIDFATIRVAVCALALLVLAFFKHFNFMNYKQMGGLYDTHFKCSSFDAYNIKDFALNKFEYLREKIKSKINSL